MKEDKEYLYDSFISYRHVPLDIAVAKRLQELLENIRLKDKQKPKKKLHIFRDTSELSTSNDLSSKIREALQQSRYLIVICSDTTKDSLWCMEEIRLFKEAHHGNTDRILTLITSGKPEDVVPKEVFPKHFFENLSASQKKLVQPLSADVSSSSQKKSLRRLKTEFLRIAAPLLGCEFDTLYQREQRRRRRNIISITAGALTTLTVVLLIVSIFAYRTWISENNYRNTLADNYARQGNNYANSNSPQEALLHYTQAIRLDPDKTPAAIGASMLLQNYFWPVQKSESPGCIKNEEYLPVPSVLAGDSQSGRYLIPASKQYAVADENGQTLTELGSGYDTYIGSQNGWWSFVNKDKLLFYNPRTEQERSIPWPEQISRGCNTDSVIEHYPNALAVSEEKVMAAYCGIIHIYTFDEQGNASETVHADLADAFPEDAERKGISCTQTICLSQDSSLALISSGSHTALYDTNDLTLKAVIPRYLNELNGKAFSPDNKYFALTFGASYRSVSNPNGLFEIYSCNGELLFSSGETPYSSAILGAAFNPKDTQQLLVWNSDCVQVWDWKKEKEIMAPLYKTNIRSACFTKEGSMIADLDGKTVSSYALLKFSAPDDEPIPSTETLPSVSAQYYLDAEGPDGKTLTGGAAYLTMKDADGSELDKVRLPVMGDRVALSKDCRTACLFSQYVPALMRVPVDFDAGSIGTVQQLDTGNSPVMTIWFDDGWLAAETASRSVLLFDQSDRLRCKIIPKHTGNIVSVISNAAMRYMIFIIKDRQVDPESYHFADTGAVEIWDVSSGMLLASHETPGQQINAVGISDNCSLLAWNTNKEAFLRCIGIPAPDEEASLFLEGLCCLALDTGQNLKPKEPNAEHLPMGNWSVLNEEYVYSEDDTSSKEDAGQTLKTLAANLSNDTDLGSDAWYQRCDTLWQRLLDHELDCTPLELDIFYNVYINAVSPDHTDKLSFGLKSYIKMTKRLLESSNDSDSDAPFLSGIDMQLNKTLAQSKDYDRLIVRTFSYLADCSNTDENAPGDSDETEIPEEYAVYSSMFLQAWSEAIQGNGTQSMSSLLEYTKDHSLPIGITTEAYVLLNLFEGNADAAADHMNQWITDYAALLRQDELDTITDTMTYYLIASEALVWRNHIDASVFDLYLRALNADIGLEVSAVSVKAQRSGLLSGDLIIEIDGRRTASRYHFARLCNSKKPHYITVLRDGEIKTILLPKKTPIGGKFTIRLRSRGTVQK